MSMFIDGAQRHVCPSKGLFHTPLSPHSHPLTDWQGPSLPRCPAITSDPAGLELSSSAAHSRFLNAPNLTSPTLLGCKNDIPLTHALLHTSSHGSTQLAICQVRSHHWAEGPRVIFYDPSVARKRSLGPLGLAPSNCPPSFTPNGARLLKYESFLFKISVVFQLRSVDLLCAGIQTPK